ncbi:MAG: aldo/keto reductase [Firmicutes bacterium]|nr:aldo/keto reductase [Bacillota bacterium]
MKSLTDTYTLYNGVQIPCVGFGTWQAPDGDVTKTAVLAALEAGYRHIDTAAAYGNEGSVGAAIAESGLAREDLFITTKLANPMHGYESTMQAFEKSMKLLGLDYLDLYLIHWPNPIKFRDCWKEVNAGTWKAFEELYKAGRIRSIGVSNFLPHHIEALMETSEILPMVNQIKLCPGETQEETAQYCREHNILLEAYSPMGTGKIFSVPQMQELAEKYNRTIAQICIRWSLQMGYLPLPKSVTPSRIQENTQVFDFELDPADVALIASLKGCCGETRDPDKTNF